MTALSARSLTYRVGATTLVDGVDLSIGPGELLAIIGPNGAGKSTLLRLLAADLRPSHGAVAFGDLVDPDEADLALYRSVLPQARRTDIPFTVREVVMMGRFPHRRDPENSAAADEQAIAEAMERTDTARYTDRVFATLSGGEQARVSLARVLAQRAPVLILDEPTAALDVAHEERVMAELAATAASGAAVVAVLHDLNTAARYATRIAAMSGGAKVADGPPADVLTSVLLTDIYRHPMKVVEHPFLDCPLVLPVDGSVGGEAP